MTNISKNIIHYIKDNVAYIILNNPKKLNAINFEMWLNIGKILEEYEINKSVRCIVLKGEGSKAFSAGADISEFDDNRSRLEEVKKYDNASKTSMRLLQQMSIPTIAMIDGYCIGGGLATALSCDLRLASEKSSFAIPAAKLGLAYDYAGIKRLREIVGPSNAKYIFYTARQFTADEAFEMGLINGLFKESEFEKNISNIINNICENAPLTISSAKMSIDANPNNDIEYKNCIEAEQVCFASNDYQEGRQAFKEKRKPKFNGN